MGINEMDFQWRLNWWYRPTDGFGISVTDYYECFCDWKDSMAINLCPANDADYVDAFIQNLKPDIRVRLESKGRSSTTRLGDAFYDAKLEESLISIDEALKEIKAMFEAPKLLDKLPSEEVDSCLHINYADSCSNLLAENLSDDEFSGLEDNESPESDENRDYGGTIDLQTQAQEVFDENPIDTILDSKPIGGYEKETASPIAACKVFDGLTAPILDRSPSIDQLLGKVDCDPITGIVEIRNAENDQLLKSVAKGGYDGEFNSPNVGRKVFKEMSYEFSIKPTEEMDGNRFYIPLIDFVPRVFDPGTSVRPYMHNVLFQPLYATTDFATFLGQCKTVLSFTSTYMVFIFDPGGCEELDWFWIEGVVCTMYCHSHECLVRCMWSQINSLVYEVKRDDMGNEECCKLFCMINGVIGSSWLNNGCDAINKRGNEIGGGVGSSVKSCKLLTELLMDYIFWTTEALNLDDVELTFGIAPITIQPGIGLKIVIDVGLHFQRHIVEFSQEGLSNLTNMEHWMYVWLGRISFSHPKATVQRVIYMNIYSFQPPIKHGQVLIFVLHRHDNEAEFGQIALVLTLSSMIEMCFVRVVPNFFHNSSSSKAVKRLSKWDSTFGILDKMCFSTSLRTRMFLRVWERVCILVIICCMEDM